MTNLLDYTRKRVVVSGSTAALLLRLGAELRGLGVAAVPTKQFEAIDG